MAVLGTSNITLPKNIAAGLWSKAQGGSTVAALSGAEPQQFGEVSYMTFTTPPRAEYVAEAAQKSPSSVGFGVVTAEPHKVQVTLRFNEEVQFADEDYQLGVLAKCGDAAGEALARALDLGVYHAVNPLTGGQVASITSKIDNTTHTVTTGGHPDTEIETAAGAVIAGGFIPNGIAFDPKFAWTLSTARYADGRKIYPELGFGTNITAFGGLNASVSSTVSGLPEATDTKDRAIVGDFTTVRWGVQRRVAVKLLTAGDPDGQGDLARQNQIALRTEVIYGWAFMDLNAFAIVKDPAS